MWRRLLHGLLWALFVLGALAALGSGLERAELQAEHDRLVKAEDILAQEPSRPELVPLNTDEPYRSEWLLRIPTGSRVEVVERRGVATTVRTLGPPQDGTIGVRLEVDDWGQLELDTVVGDWTQPDQRLAGDESVTQYLGRADRIRAESPAGDRPIPLDDPARPVVLVRFTMPEDLRAKADQYLVPVVYDQVYPVIYELSLRPVAP